MLLVRPRVEARVPDQREHRLDHGARHHEQAQAQVALVAPDDRDHLGLVEDSGLEVVSSREWYAKGPKPMSAFYLMRCRVPA